MANLGLEWDVPGTGGLTLTGQAVYTSSQYADAANKQELPAWTRFDLGARYLTELDGHLLTLRAHVIHVATKNYRSDEPRGGKECDNTSRSRWSPSKYKK